MEIVQPYAKMLNVPDREAGIKLLRHIEWCARISHRSEDAQTEDSWDRFLRAVVVNHSDYSVIEHSVVSVDTVTDRGAHNEWVRHRIGGYTAESTRFVNYQKKLGLSFVCPFKDGSVSKEKWTRAMLLVEEHYAMLIASGEPPQLARSLLPLSLAVRMVTTYNLRSWRHFFLMRTTKETHPQMREVSEPLLLEFKEKIPILFEDIEPGELQRENLRKPR